MVQLTGVLPCATPDSSPFGSRPVRQSWSCLPLQGTSFFTRVRDEEGKDYDQNIPPTSGIAIARIITSIAAANDLELHSIDIEQALLQADKLMEGGYGRYFINPPTGEPRC